MLEVKASEIVTADKMRGVGPANIIFTAGPNPVAEDRRGVAKVTAGGESKSVTITQAAGEQVVVILRKAFRGDFRELLVPDIWVNVVPY
mgnify:CR=1 FL=1